MPYKEREINKLYYTMGEVTEMFDVNASQIRFYEKEFDILQPKKNKKGNRLFTQEDIANLKIIFNLVKDKGYTLQGAREYLRSNKSAEEFSKDERKIYEYIKEHQQIAIDDISLYCDWPQSKLAITLLEMEMKGFIIALPGKIYRLI